LEAKGEKGEIGYVTKTEIKFVPSGHPSVDREETQSVKEKKKEIRIHTAGYMMK